MSVNSVYYLGIDEAGRGSVIGPLVMGAVVINQKTLELYTKLGITDSKKLTSQKREEFFETIKGSSSSFSTVLLSPADIDSAVISTSTNLNMLELQTMTDLIIKHSEATDVYIDAISKPDYCTSNLKSLLKKETSFSMIKKVNTDTLQMVREFNNELRDVRLIAQNKADLNYKAVSAASILAKVTRDSEIRKLEKEFNLEEKILASGYPNQQLLPFLEQYKKEIKAKKFPFIRYSWDWAPLRKIVSKDSLKQSKLVY